MSLWQLFKAIPRALAALIVGIGTFLSRQWEQYTEFGQFLWVLALLAMGVDAGISYEFGTTLSYLHAAGFALVALAFCILPDVSALEWRKGNKTSAGWIGFACVPLGFVALLTHVGYSASIRVGDMQQASAQNAIFNGRTDTSKKLDEKVAFLEKRRDALDKEMDSLVNIKVGEWAVSVKPSSPEELDGAIEAKRLEATNEGKRKGCKSKCELRNNELAHLMKLRAKAKEIADNAAQHSAAIEGIATALNQAEATGFKSSAAANHNDTLFKALNLVVNREYAEAVTSNEREATNTGIMGLSSVAFLLLAPMFYFAAGLNRRRGVMDDWMGISSPVDTRTAPKAEGSMTLQLADMSDDIRKALLEMKNTIQNSGLKVA